MTQMLNNRGGKKMKIVVKIGTSSIVNHDGALNTIRMTKLTQDLIALRAKNHQVALVSSGAVACGRKYTTLLESSTARAKQFFAALGQPEMFKTWQKIFQLIGKITCAQLLYTSFDLNPDNKTVYQATKNCLELILEQNVMPIINENDAVSVEELEMMSSFGDNAHLAALVAGIINADVLCIATDTNGILDENGITIPLIIDPHKFELKLFRDQEKSKLGTGGAKANLKAAKVAQRNGIETVIFNSANDGALGKIISGISSHKMPKTMNFTYIPKRK